LTGRNEAKYEALKYIYEVGLATDSEIAEFRGVTHGCQSSLLQRYWKHGLLHRCSGEGKEKVYSLSDRGYERLEWLESKFEDIELDFNPEIYLKRCARNVMQYKTVGVDG
jgi:DNA-binding MarR family transcriptional regulator